MGSLVVAQIMLLLAGSDKLVRIVLLTKLWLAVLGLGGVVTGRVPEAVLGDGVVDGRAQMVGGRVLAVHVEEAVESVGLEGRLHQLLLTLFALLPPVALAVPLPAALPPVPCGGLDTKLGLLLLPLGRMV